MTRTQPLWMLLCMGLSAGVNHAMAPVSPYELSIGERTMATGDLTLSEGGKAHRYQLITIHVVAADTQRLLAEPLHVRELWLRSPEQAGVSDLDLFIDFSREEQVIAPDARDIQVLRRRPLPVALRAEGGELPSLLRLPGSTESARVVQGELVIDEAIELEKGNPAHGWRVRGELELTLADGDATRSVAGELNARLVWD